MLPRPPHLHEGTLRDVQSRGKSGRCDYLSTGRTILPRVYFLLSLVYFGLVVFWISILYKKRLTAFRIHFFMLAVLILKALNLLCEAEDKSYIKRTGSAHGWDVLFCIFSFLKCISLFTLIVLIGTGWSFLKPCLQNKEKNVLMIVIPLQVVANIAQVAIDEIGPFSQDLGMFLSGRRRPPKRGTKRRGREFDSWEAHKWDDTPGGRHSTRHNNREGEMVRGVLPREEQGTWKQVFLLVDVICCCAVLFPIVWSIKNLREAAKTDGKAAVKLTLFRPYYVVMICYIYFTRVVVYALKTITLYRYLWTSVVAAELATLAFYVFTGYKFKPEAQNPYFAFDDGRKKMCSRAVETR